MERVPLMLGLAMLALPVAAQSVSEAIIKREEARIAATRSGQGREQFYSRDYVMVNPPGAVVAGFQPPAQPNAAAYAKDIKVVVATQSAAVVALLQGPRPATAQVASASDPDRFLHVWANEQGTWRLVARQGVWVRPAESAGATVKAPIVSPYQPKGTDEIAIFKVHQALEEAFARHDAAAYESHTVPEFIRISDYGQVTARAEWLKTSVVGQAARVPSVATDVRIRVYGDAAVMTYRNNARNAEGMTSARASRMMRAFVQRDGAWKLAATISTIVWPTSP